MKNIRILYLTLAVLFSSFSLQSSSAFDRNPTSEINVTADLQKYYLTCDDYGEDKFPTPNASNWDVFWEKSQLAAQNMSTLPEEQVQAFSGVFIMRGVTQNFNPYDLVANGFSWLSSKNGKNMIKAYTTKVFKIFK